MIGRNVWAKWVGPLVLVLFLASCASERLDLKKFERDGVQYGQVEGTFRGRWWNYYERGRSLLEGGFYEQAVLDMNVALKDRARDQYWPRTYGLHFAREYFPHRELGVARYFQEDYDGALTELELSYEQQPSSRSAYYLNQVRKRQLIASGADKAPPSVRVLSPTAAAVSDITLVMEGEAADDQYVVDILVDGQVVDLGLGLASPTLRFTHEITLGPGRNTFDITVTDLAGNSIVETVTLDADHDGPVVSFDPNVSLPGKVTGQLWDDSGVESLNVLGQPATLSPGNDGVYDFAVDIPANVLVSPVTYACLDTIGNETTGELTVDRLDVAAMQPDIQLASFVEDWGLPSHIEPEYKDGRLAALKLAQEITDDVEVRFRQVRDGERLYQNETVIGIDATASTPISRLEWRVDDYAYTIDVKPARTRVVMSKKIATSDFRAYALAATAEDTTGKVAQQELTIERVASPLEVPLSKLQVVLIQDEPPATNPAGIDLETLLSDDNLIQPLLERFTVVDRRNMDEILQELNLQKIASSQDRLRLNQLVVADTLFFVSAHADNETTTVKVDTSSTYAGVRLAADIDITVENSNTTKLASLLKTSFLNAFPVVQGTINWNGAAHEIDYSAQSGVQDHYNFLIVHEVEDALGGKIPVPVAQGVVTRLARPGGLLGLGTVIGPMSTELATPPEQFRTDQGYYIVTK